MTGQTKCKRCGDKEFRINGFCSVYCDDMWDVEEEVIALRAALERTLSFVKGAGAILAVKTLAETSDYSRSHAVHK
jgi:hypothetical protein